MPFPKVFLRALVALTLCAGLAACDSMPEWMGGRKPNIERLPGERADALPDASAAAPDEALKALPVSLPAVNANADWPQHSAMISATGGNLAGGAFENRQSATIGEGDDFGSALLVRPVVAAGLVFAMDGTGHISAHDAADIGTVRWQSAGVAEEDDPELLGGGLAFADGKLYAVSGRGVLAAFDAASGKELWKKNLRLPFRSPPRVAGDRLFAITIDSQTFALSATNGDVLWTHRGIRETGGIMSSVSPALIPGGLIVPYASGELYALSQDSGQERWAEMLAPGSRTQAGVVFSSIGGDPAVDGDVVFAAASGGGLSVFAASSGQRLWSRDIGSVNSPWLAGDFLFVLTSDNRLLSMVKYTGQVKWAVQLKRFLDEERSLKPVAWRGPVMADGKLYVAGSNGQLAVVAADSGTISELRDIPDDITAAPVIAGGRMYLVGQDATLYELQ